ncbi:unnamed protein product [Chilo suppressalis]|uniref:Uncharacterized protein n=1 Tax=Chilo suppressalis TaxID=168631 RepID=A0ABN8L7P5_CHISP|nr:unnamed protein product [Chilo suppressalis]
MLRRASFLLGCLLLVFIAETTSEHVPFPFITTAPPPKFEVRFRRNVNDEPLWLYKGDDINRAPATGDHPYLPPYIDDVKLDPSTRYARSVDSPSAKRGGGSHSTSSSRGSTGPTHPGYNRRNARSLHTPTIFNSPSPTIPKPYDHIFPGPRLPTYERHARDIQMNPLQKPTHYDITIPGWNPNARVQPWQKIRVRTGRDIHDIDSSEDSIDL